MFDLSVPFKWFPGQIFAQDGPGRVFATNGIVGGDELPLGRSVVGVFVGVGIANRERAERDSSRNEGRWEFVPPQMRKWRCGLSGGRM